MNEKIKKQQTLNTTNIGEINGYDERKKFYDLMKIIFDYENCN